jgi:hypothetical protein
MARKKTATVLDPPPTDCDQGGLDQLTSTVDTLAQEVRVLGEAIDELRELLEWAMQNREAATSTVFACHRYPASTATQWILLPNYLWTKCHYYSRFPKKLQDSHLTTAAEGVNSPNDFWVKMLSFLSPSLSMISRSEFEFCSGRSNSL